MAKQTILWTVLPYGRVPQGQEAEGQWRISVMVAPRLTPENAGEQSLAAFPEFLNWPQTLQDAGFRLLFGSGKQVDLTPLSKPDGDIWKRLLPADTPVAGWSFTDMSKVNLHSFPLRNVLGFVKKHYSRLAVQAASNHPSLLPWKAAHPDLKDMLTEAGTRTRTLDFGNQSVEQPLPGFERFFGDDIEKLVGKAVFGPDGIYDMAVAGPDAGEQDLPKPAGKAQVRALPPDWYNPQPGGEGTPLVSAPDAALMAQFSSQAEYSLYQANRFYRRDVPTDTERRMRRPDFQNTQAPPKPPEFDFHRIVASYSDYGALLRRLGLVLDFALRDSDVLNEMIAVGGGAAKGQIRLQMDWAGPHDVSGDVTPKTAWAADKERFFTRPRDKEQKRGLLRLEHSDDGWNTGKDDIEGLFDIYQVDPDGAALKTVDFVLSSQRLLGKHLSVRQKHGEVTYTTGDRQAVAALRSGGLGVSQHGRAQQVANDAAAAALKNNVIGSGSGNQVVMFAEDLHRGYRVDVAAVDDELSSGKWRSLCARSGEYRVIPDGGMLEFAPDEGYVSGASTTSSADPATDPDDHYLHESLFRWTGWSLCAPRPGLTIRAEGDPDSALQSETPTIVEDTAEKGNNLAVSYKALKGSLPKLRFGQLYRFRARVVDAAGNSLSPDDPTLGDFEQASDAVGYWRFEPVDPPALVHRARVSEGESLERMVIRSNYDADPAAYLASPDFATAIADPASADFDYTARNERHLVPPKSSQQQCETHGLFDAYYDNWASIKQGYEIAAREAGTLYDEPPGAQVELITPSAQAGVATTAKLPPALPSPENPVGDRIVGGQYIIHREAQIQTPYLPDGAAEGIALRAAPDHTIPGVSGEAVLGPSCAVRKSRNGHLVIQVKHGDVWPYSTGFRLVLAERVGALSDLPCAENFADDGEPDWDESSRTLTLFVSKGRIERLVYSSYVGGEYIGYTDRYIGDFGLPVWADSEEQGRFIADTAMAGCNWLLTPFRTLTLVHATQQPICLPELEKLSISRGRGDQEARLTCRNVRLHGPSTGKFEIEATWHEWVDDLNQDEPKHQPFHGQLGEIKLDENHVNEFILKTAVDAQVLDPEAARADVHALGDTRFRLIQYRARATTRFREYLPPVLYGDTEKVTRLGPVAEGPGFVLPAPDDPGAPVLRDPTGSTAQSLVYASAPPDDPRVLYVVPTFRWNDTQTDQKYTSIRQGNGLRVWLDRPWFSSGDGELLGVVLSGDGGRFTDISQQQQSLVTQWGLDPLWGTSLPKSRSRVTDFTARVTDEPVTLQEGSTAHVVGHRVHWDASRSLWYCDIELEPGSTYMPFVRLALVRYQPNARSDAKVSKVVQAEFAQVLPRRKAVISVDGNTISAGLHGPSPQSGPMKFTLDSAYQDVSFVNATSEAGRNRVELVLQTRDPALDTDLAWKDAKILVSEVVGASSGGGGGFDLPGGIFTRDLVRRRVETRASGLQDLEARIDHGILEARPNLPGTLMPRDPAFWSAQVDLPADDGKPRRLMLREFERFYTDDVKAERVGTSTHQRRFIEERLIYASIFTL